MEAFSEPPALEIPTSDEQRQIAAEIGSLATRISSARGPHELQLIVVELRSKVEALAVTVSASNGTCREDGAPLYRANGPDGAYDYCIYGHRWPA
ncbi:MAG TPA: hypothetical protein VME22_02530 [Solirubrobacteraceae bacterium]|nr:hypothetical protein [Solirubrobacteraceae bacterium]